MQEEKTKPHILYSCYAYQSKEGESFIADHIFGYVFSGSSEVHIGNKKYAFNEGDFRFFRKNQLGKYVKFPPDGGEYKSISVTMDEGILRNMSNELGLSKSRPYTGESSLLLKPNHLLRNYIDSLTPYINGSGDFNKVVTLLKVKEAVMILLETNPSLKDVLFDFSQPGKIDLEAYMNEHYRYNVNLERFAYLTGRSLATFKRDFERIFNLSPNRWLQQKRLQEAHYLIKVKGKLPSAVYVDLGFENLSHFSFVFKKMFGISPSKI